MVDKETILQTFKIFYLIMSYPPTPMKSWALLPMKQYVLLHKRELTSILTLMARKIKTAILFPIIQSKSVTCHLAHKLLHFKSEHFST